MREGLAQVNSSRMQSQAAAGKNMDSETADAARGRERGGLVWIANGDGDVVSKQVASEAETLGGTR